jgi:hypothetical protein
MSRIEYDVHDERTQTSMCIACGWDRPLQAFFIDVFDREDPNGPPMLDLWPGFPKITTIAELRDFLAKHGFERVLTTEAADYLELDKRQNAGSTIRHLPDAVLD